MLNLWQICEIVYSNGQRSVGVVFLLLNSSALGTLPYLRLFVPPEFEVHFIPNLKTGNPGDVGTVGAVALDGLGNLAAATSTGGMNGKMVGRSSDTCMIGSGTYADNDVAAISTTGHGETIAKFCLANSIIREMMHGKSAQNATKEVLEQMTLRLNNTAGAITLDKNGNVGIFFTSNKMAWAYRLKDTIHFGIHHEQHETEQVKVDK